MAVVITAGRAGSQRQLTRYSGTRVDGMNNSAGRTAGKGFILENKADRRSCNALGRGFSIGAFQRKGLKR
jgi:hypothetical protein